MKRPCVYPFLFSRFNIVFLCNHDTRGAFCLVQTAWIMLLTYAATDAGSLYTNCV